MKDQLMMSQNIKIDSSSNKKITSSHKINKPNVLDLDQLNAYQAAKTAIANSYATDSGKKFIHHLVYAYLDNTTYVMMANKHYLIDCLTNSKIYPIFDFNVKKLKIDQDLKESLESWESEENGEIRENIANSLLSDERVTSKITNSGTKYNIRYACTSTLTNKYLGKEELQALTEFIQEQVNNGNRTIIGMVQKAQNDNYEKPSKKSSTPNKKTSKKSLENTAIIKGDINSLSSESNS